MTVAPLPSARDDLLGAIDWLIAQVEKNAQDLDRLKKALALRDTMGIPELAQRWGFSAKALYRDIVKQPNYGLPDIGMGRKAWFLSTVEAWEAIPEDERRDRWERMSAEDRRKYLGPLEGSTVARERRKTA